MMPYLTNAPKPTKSDLKEIEALEAEAANARRRREESFDRCDTDGFLSQWANDMTFRLNSRKIELLKNGGHAPFPVLCDEDGNVIAEKIYEFTNPGGHWLPMNRRWRIDPGKYDRKWIPVGKNSRIQKKLKLHEETRWFPAYAKITTGGRKSTGLSGCANAFVAVFKKGEDND